MSTAALIQVNQLPVATSVGQTDLTVIYQNGVLRSTTVALFQPAASGVLLIANNLSDVQSAVTARTNLGLGTAATANTGTSGGVIPLLSGVNTWSGAQTFGAVSFGTITGGTWNGGTITVPYGGTGQITLTTHGVLLGEGAAAIGATAAGTSGQLLQSGGASADPGWTTATYPTTTTINQLLYSSSANTIAGLTTGNNGVLITSGGGVPSISSTLPTAVQGNITSVGTLTALTVTPGAISGVIATFSGLLTGNLGLTVTGGAVSLSPASFNVTLSPTGTGVVTINPATAGTMDNVQIGATTALAGKFTTLTTTSTGNIQGTLTLGVASSASGILVLEGSASGAVTVKTVSNAGTWTLTLPTSGGSNLQFLQTDGSGNSSWQTVSAGGAGTSGQLAWYSATGSTSVGNANATISNGALTLGVANTTIGQLILEGNTSGAVTISPLAAAGTWTFSLPASGGTNLQFLQTDGSGNSTWQTAAGFLEAQVFS